MAKFEDYQKEIDEVVELYHGRWTLTSYPWEDLKQDIKIRIYNKWHLYDPARPIRPWIATLTQHFIKNELRNRYFIYKEPCLKCEMHLGDGLCKMYGEKLGKCGLYRKFEEQKSNAANLKFPVSYEGADYDAVQNFSYPIMDFANDIKNCISGIQGTIFNMFYESGMSKTRIAKTMSISGWDTKARLKFVEISLVDIQKKAVEILEEKKAAMGYAYARTNS